MHVAAISMSGYLAGNALSAPRLLFATARDGFLPALLASIHPRVQTGQGRVTMSRERAHLAFAGHG